MKEEVRHLFHQLADLPQHERDRVLAEAQIGPDIRAEVESLLSFDSSSQVSLTNCVARVAEEILEPSRDAAFDLANCGPYRLRRRVGLGGMGSVYLAERRDGEIQQQVAIKLLRYEYDRSSWRERFLKERQLLASLNHPSIVHVIDAGHTADGRPYLAMEYVEGIPIDVFANSLDLGKKLHLFLHVCEAVSHAHRRLIIHRDLKPSNILVNSEGLPKLLDFGIARLLDDTGEKNRTVDRLLTPNYASPEQLRGDNQSTATDIYSLGAVLYKLVTDRSPHELDSKTSKAIEVAAGTGEIAPPTALNPSLPGDLDYILAKALRYEPDERYASVDALADDVRAFLESRPIHARSGSTWYRVEKFLHRHWAPAAAATLAAASLIVGLYLANHARTVAERRFLQLRTLSNKVFDLDKAIRDLPGSVEARQGLVSASLEYLEGLATDVQGDVALTRDVAQGYWRIGRIQGVPVELNLGEPGKAELSLKKADELMDAVLAASPNDRTALLRSATIAADRMILAQEGKLYDDARTHARKAAARIDALSQRGDLQASEHIEIVTALGNIGLAHLNMHLYKESATYARRSLEAARASPATQYLEGQALSVLANALRYEGDLEGAHQAIQEARQVSETAMYTNDTIRMIDLYGVLLREGLIFGEDGGVTLDRPDEAIEPLQRALRITEEIARKDPNDATSRSRVGTSGRHLGNILRKTDPQRALEAYDLAARRLSEIRNGAKARRDRAIVLAESSYALRSLHRPGEARQRIAAALAILKETKDYPAERVELDSAGYVVLSALADDQADEGDVRRASSTYEELLGKVMAAQPEVLSDLRDAPRLSRLYADLARMYRQTGDLTKAQNIESKRLDLWHQWDEKLPNNAFIQRQLQAAAANSKT